MLTAFIRGSNGTVTTDASEEAVRRALAEGCEVWLDMLAPDERELRYLTEVFQFHPLAVEDATSRAQRPKLEDYQRPEVQGCRGYFYMVIHGPDVDTFREHLRTKELDVFFSDKFVVTIHDEPMVSTGGVLDKAKASPQHVFDLGIDGLLHKILDKLVDLYEPIFDYLTDAIDELEERAAEDPEPGLLREISRRKHELLELRRVIAPQREVLAQFARGDVPFVRDQARVYYRDVLDHLNRAVETIEIYRDLVVGARDIYMSSVSNNLNKVMKTLTIITVLSLPFTVITGFFGMNFQHLPGLGSTAAFWTAVCAMVAGVALILTIFRWLRWL